MKTVLLLLSTDRFSLPLIRYLVLEGSKYKWKTHVGSMFDSGITARIKEDKCSNDITFIDITDFKQCDSAIRKADIVIGILPDVMLMQVADSCIQNGKSLIAPSRMTRQMALKKKQAEKSDVLLLMECGFSPGLDHITAKKVIDSIHSKGGEILEFKTYSGSLIAENCMDNPWGFKLTEPTSEIIHLGRHNNRHLINKHLQHIPYHQVFARSEPVNIREMKNIIAIPEGDSLYYRKIYQLTKAHTVVKAKLVRKGFEHLWNLLIKLGLTDNKSRVDMLEEKSFNHFMSSLLPYSPSESLEYRLQKYGGASPDDIEKLKWLGLFDETWLDGVKEFTASIILQHLLEEKFGMKAEDKDCIVMQHELQYLYRNSRHNFTATLITYGENQYDSAIARVIGYTIGAAAKAFLLGSIKIAGLHIPIQKEIYDPILTELDELGVAFHVEEKKLYDDEINEAVISKNSE